MPVQYNFEWDPAKAKANLKKHRVSFETAVAVFRDPLAVTVFDQEHEEDEDRWVTLGIAEKDELLVVIHTFREMTDVQEITIRMISARRATRREQRQYEASP
jgi:uncharacterized protein